MPVTVSATFASPEEAAHLEKLFRDAMADPAAGGPMTVIGVRTHADETWWQFRSQGYVMHEMGNPSRYWVSKPVAPREIEDVELDSLPSTD